MFRHQKRKTLTPRQLRLVEGVAAGKGKAQAARDAGYAETTAVKQASTILNRPLVRSALTVALERQGVTLEKVVQPLVDGQKANVVVKDGRGPRNQDPGSQDPHGRLKPYSGTLRRGPQSGGDHADGGGIDYLY